MYYTEHEIKNNNVKSLNTLCESFEKLEIKFEYEISKLMEFRVISIIGRNSKIYD